MASNDLGVHYPLGTDEFAPHLDIEQTADSLQGRVVVPVANTTERASVASALSPSASEPLYVWRTDARDGFQLEVSTNGTTWATANRTSRDGAQDLMQSGSYVGTTASNGTLNLTFNTPFTVATKTVTVAPGATSGGLASVACTGVPTLTGVQLVCYNPTGVLLNGQTVRINWIATGY